MVKIYNERLKVTYFKEVLENGLTIFIFHDPLKIKTTCAFGTPYGGLNINQRLTDKEYHFNPGVAHFLEHKLFESDERNILEEFTKMGADVNAFTSYFETVYYFSMSSNKIEKPLNLLLDFVQNFNVTDESVEKEKGIILEEVMMHMQEPSERLVHEAYKALYEKHPIIHDIGGDKESIYKITKEELDECYHLNYHPSNMILTISSPIEPTQILEIVKNNQNKKHFTKRDIPVDINEHEKIQPNISEHNFNMPISTNKQVIAYKIVPDFKDQKEANYLENCLNIFFGACFSPLNPKYQEWLDKGYINDFFGYELEFRKDFAYVMFYIENNDKTILEKIIKDGFNLDNLNEDIIKQLKRRHIGISIYELNDDENFVLSFTREYLEGIDFFDDFEELQHISLKDVEKAIKIVENSPKCIINMNKELS